MGCTTERQGSEAAGRRSLWRARRAAPGLILGCLAAGALGLVLPALAPAATTAKITPSFVASKTGSALRLGYRISEPAGGVPGAAERAVIDLPKGTGINLSSVPKSQLCNFGILVTRAVGPNACPKGSRAGPTGSAELEATIGGKLATATVPIYPFVVELADGSRALMVSVMGSGPFPEGDILTLVPYKGNELLMGLGAGEVTPGDPNSRQAIVNLSLTIGQNARITPPKSCPGGGYAWSTDFSFIEGPDVTARATSSCAAKGKRASAGLPARAAAAPTTQFQCEKTFHTSQGRSACFNRLPGASCAHPLEVQKTDPNYRGDTKDFKVSLYMEPGDEEARAIYEYHPKPNVAICPYPMGAVFKVSLIYRQLPNGWSEQVHEYDTKNIPEPTTRHGGGFEYIVTNHPVTSWYLVIKGYYVHPPWAHGG